MITAFIFYLAGIIFYIVLAPLAFLSATLEKLPVLDDVVTYFIDAIMYFQGLVNIPALFAAITFVLNFFLFLFTVRILFFFLTKIPVIGSVFDNPFRRLRVDEISETEMSQLPTTIYQRHGVIDAKGEEVQTGWRYVIQTIRDRKIRRRSVRNSQKLK